MTSIQSVSIRDHEDRAKPKPHVVYRIEVQAGVRSWQVWRRYSEFDDLHTELSKSTGAAPPAPLPAKHSLSIFRSKDDPKLVEERRSGLEAYLRAIVANKDERWRESFAFRDFLNIPVGKPSAMGGGGEGGATFNSSSWLDEHVDLQARIRDIRADINRRDALSSGSDVGGAHSANVQAKKKLAGVLSSVGALEAGLNQLGMSGMAEGELRRRRDMAALLRDDCEKLAKIVTVARHSAAAGTATAPVASDRQSLLQTGSAFAAKPGRVFGAPQPVETEETRPLDDQGLFMLQQNKIEQQDQNLDQLTAVLRRQRQIGMAIHEEVEQQNELLDDLNNQVDHVGDHLAKTKKQMNRLG